MMADGGGSDKRVECVDRGGFRTSFVNVYTVMEARREEACFA